MSSISIIGTGNMARTLGALAIKGGHAVEVIGRDPAKAAALAKELGAGAGTWAGVPAGDLVIVAVPYAAVVPAVTQFGEALAGKTLIEISNPFNATFDGLALAEGTSVAQEAAKAAPRAHVVKAFNTIFRAVLEKGRPDVLLAGDAAEAKAAVAAFIESLGLRALDVGALKMAHWLEGAGLLLMGLARNGVGHFGFSLGVTELAG